VVSADMALECAKSATTTVDLNVRPANTSKRQREHYISITSH
jgi:hypothetical protein